MSCRFSVIVPTYDRVALVRSCLATVMAVYLHVALKPNSAAQYPERLHREPALMVAVVATSIAMLVLLRLDLPSFHRLVRPPLP